MINGTTAIPNRSVSASSRSQALSVTMRTLLMVDPPRWPAEWFSRLTLMCATATNVPEWCWIKLTVMSVLFLADERCLDHDPGRRHPERPRRVDAVRQGVLAAGLGEALV